MNFDNSWLFLLGIAFQVLVFIISLFTIWGIVKLIIFNRKIERIKKKYFDKIVDNVIVSRIEYFRLMEDFNFLNKFKEFIKKSLPASEEIEDDYEKLKKTILSKKKTIRKFKISLLILGIIILIIFLGFLLKDFIFSGNSYCFFLFANIVFLTVSLFYIKFIL
ncbi:hypothetical protein M0R01_04725 [bacterium]|nr:hypothetical protein [bacterium]